MKEFAIVRMDRPEAGSLDLAPGDPRRCRYYILAASKFEAMSEAGRRWPNEVLTIVAERPAPVHDFPEDKPASKTAQKAMAA